MEEEESEEEAMEAASAVGKGGDEEHVAGPVAALVSHPDVVDDVLQFLEAKLALVVVQTSSWDLPSGVGR